MNLKNTIKMQLIDTHAHLYVEAFDEDQRYWSWNAAIATGVTHFYIPAIDSAYHGDGCMHWKPPIQIKCPFDGWAYIQHTSKRKFMK